MSACLIPVAQSQTHAKRSNSAVANMQAGVVGEVGQSRRGRGQGRGCAVAVGVVVVVVVVVVVAVVRGDQAMPKPQARPGRQGQPQ